MTIKKTNKKDLSFKDIQRIIKDADATDDDYFDPEHFYYHQEPLFWETKQ
jgi:hypothetical protein